MLDNKTTVERAFELARAGNCYSLDDIRRKLKSEQYEAIDSHISGHSIRRQLNELLALARSQLPVPK